MVTSSLKNLDSVRLTALKGVLRMDLDYGMKNAFGITARNALVNLEVLSPGKRLTRAKKERCLNVVTEILYARESK